ncbi:MAG: beta-lactamase family protein [Verrucomicrobia bacterium]|nr:beta-lactamase family protein [Verrucomicrobiota bacterium]
MRADGLASALHARFAENFRAGRELGAAVSVWKDGVEIASLADGWCEREHRRPWASDTLVPLYSATKGPASAALLLALARHGLGPETPVREVWPAFPVAEADFGHLLSHQCGLFGLDRKAGVWDHGAGVAAIEAQVPAMRPGEGHAYHPRTFGVLVDEPVRRLAGMPLGEFWWREIARPLGLDLWIGLPEGESGRVAKLYPGVPSKRSQDAFYLDFMRKGSPTWRAFHALDGLTAVHEMNQPRAWAAGLPALGGVGSASALAKFYQAAIGRIPGVLPEDVCRWLGRPMVSGPDRVLLRDTVFTCGCQMDPVDGNGTKRRRLYGPSAEAFGHPGAGGSHGFGDPRTGVSFAYAMNLMELSVMPGTRCQDLVDAAFA